MPTLLPSTCARQSSPACHCFSLSVTDLFALALPHLSTLWSCSSVHVSRSTDLTLLMCVPMPRWIPEHLLNFMSACFFLNQISPFNLLGQRGRIYRMHIKTPRFQLAHRGSTQNQRHNSPRSAPVIVYARLFLLQSEQLLLASSLTRLFSVARFCSARSAAGLGRLDMVSVGKAGWNVPCAGGRFAVQAGWLAYRTGRNVSGEWSAVGYEAAVEN